MICDIRESTCCPSTGANGEDVVFGYLVDAAPAHPEPTVTCPDDYNAWLNNGEYIIPDFTEAVEIDDICLCLADYTITQDPPAGTSITSEGDVNVTLFVVTPFDTQIECGFTIHVFDPTAGGTTPPPIVDGAIKLQADNGLWYLLRLYEDDGLITTYVEQTAVSPGVRGYVVLPADDATNHKLSLIVDDPDELVSEENVVHWYIDPTPTAMAADYSDLDLGVASQPETYSVTMIVTDPSNYTLYVNPTPNP